MARFGMPGAGSGMSSPGADTPTDSQLIEEIKSWPDERIDEELQRAIAVQNSPVPVEGPMAPGHIILAEKTKRNDVRFREPGGPVPPTSIAEEALSGGAPQGQMPPQMQGQMPPQMPPQMQGQMPPQMPPGGQPGVPNEDPMQFLASLQGMQGPQMGMNMGGLVPGYDNGGKVGMPLEEAIRILNDPTSSPNARAMALAVAEEKAPRRMGEDYRGPDVLREAVGSVGRLMTGPPGGSKWDETKDDVPGYVLQAMAANRSESQVPTRDRRVPVMGQLSSRNSPEAQFFAAHGADPAVTAPGGDPAMPDPARDVKTRPYKDSGGLGAFHREYQQATPPTPVNIAPYQERFDTAMSAMGQGDALQGQIDEVAGRISDTKGPDWRSDTILALGAGLMGGRGNFPEDVGRSVRGALPYMQQGRMQESRVKNQALREELGRLERQQGRNADRRSEAHRGAMASRQDTLDTNASLRDRFEMGQTAFRSENESRRLGISEKQYELSRDNALNAHNRWYSGFEFTQEESKRNEKLATSRQARQIAMDKFSFQKFNAEESRAYTKMAADMANAQMKDHVGEDYNAQWQKAYVRALEFLSGGNGASGVERKL